MSSLPLGPPEASTWDIPDDLLAFASEEEKLAYQRALEVKAALQSPLDFACHVSPLTKRYLHAEYLNRILVKLVAGELLHPRTGLPVSKLAITEPPRHGKSYMVSDHLPAWFLARWPEKFVCVASYEADFAGSWGTKARAHLEEHPEFGIPLDPKTTAGKRWNSGLGGGMFTAGAGGAITGKGADLFVADDLIKNAEEAMSEVYRQSKHEWYLTVAQTRLEPDAKIILMMTRWHSDDVMGRLITDEPDEWYVLRLPALAEEDDPLGRPVGAALCPERYDEAALHKIRVSQGAQWFASMYQGSPYIEGGGLFKSDDFRYWTDTPKHYNLDGVWVEKESCTRFMTMDVAATVKSSSDFTVLSTWDVTKDRRLILVDRKRRRMETPELGPFVVEEYDRVKAKWILIENKTFGMSLIQMFQRGTYGTRVIVRPFKAETDKISRAMPAVAHTEAHKVFFPKDATWLLEWEKELLEFDKGAHDDQVDTFSFAAHEVTTGALGSVPVIRSRDVSAPPATLKDRVDRYVERKLARGAHRHPQLGRW